MEKLRQGCPEGYDGQADDRFAEPDLLADYHGAAYGHLRSQRQARQTDDYEYDVFCAVMFLCPRVIVLLGRGFSFCCTNGHQN